MNRRSVLKGAALVAVGGVVGGGVVRALDWAGDPSGSDGTGFGRSVAGSGVDTPRVFSRVETGESLVALTFDDGPSSSTKGILDVLDQRNVRATFNIIGERVQGRTDLLRREDVRHDLGNHTWSHRQLAGLSPKEIDSELRRTDDIIDRVTGKQPRYLRPPGGGVSPEVLSAASAFGYDVLLWSLQLPGRDRYPDPVQYVVNHIHPGAIILAHDGDSPSGSATLNALPRLIDRIKDLGYVFVTVSELTSAGNPVQGDAI